MRCSRPSLIAQIASSAWLAIRSPNAFKALREADRQIAKESLYHESVAELSGLSEKLLGLEDFDMRESLRITYLISHKGRNDLPLHCQQEYYNLQQEKRADILTACEMLARDQDESTDKVRQQALFELMLYTLKGCAASPLVYQRLDEMTASYLMPDWSKEIIRSFLEQHSHASGF